MAGTDYSPRFGVDDMLEQSRPTPIRCPVYRGGLLQIPTEAGSTVTIYDAGGTAVVDAEAVTVTDGIATYTLLAATVASSVRSMGWRIEWSLVMPDGLTHVFRNGAALVRNRFYASICDQDLYARVRMLDPSRKGCIHSEQTFQDKIDEMRIFIETKLIGMDERPNLILSSLREVELLHTLALIFDDFKISLNKDYADRAAEFHTQFEAAWDALSFKYDANDNGADDDDTRIASTPPVFLMSRA